jgi:flagella basal body P-ring formation protein FlgA
MATLLLAALLAAAPAAAPVHPMVDVPVLGRTVERGEMLSASDFAVEQRAPGWARGATPVASAVGLQAAHRLGAGTVVRGADLMRPQLVKRGETVTIAFDTGGLKITTKGRALSGGGVGDPVRVMSTATNRTLDATVEGSGRVRLATR